MSKYIIEINPEYEDKFRGVMILGAENSNLYVDSQTVDELEELTADYINEHFGSLQDMAYQKGLAEGNNIGYKDGVKDGQNEAWECAKKIALMDTETSENVTGYFGLFRIMENLTPMQAIAKLKAYEDDKIKRGDIVNVKGSCNDDLLGVVTKVWEDNCYIMWGDGSGGTWCKNSVVKTGKHIDVDKFLGGLSSDS